MKVEFTILGCPIALKNNRRVFRNPKTGKTVVIGSSKSLVYADSFALQVPASAKLALGAPDSHLRLSVRLFYPNWRFDVDFAGISDCLQRSGVISNDRWIREVHLNGRAIDKDNPRAEIVIEELDQ